MDFRDKVKSKPLFMVDRTYENLEEEFIKEDDVTFYVNINFS